MIRRRAVLATSLALPALAQGWAPDRPIRLVVPFAPGGAQDVLGRLFAQAVAGPLGQTVAVENRSGAGGIVGAETVALAPPDGHVLLLATAGQITIPQAIGRRLPYDPVGGFTPVAHLTDSPMALVAGPATGATDVAGLIAALRRGGEYGSTGVGTITHLTMEDLKARESLPIEHVPYRGAANAFNDLLAGRIAAMFVSVPSVLGFGSRDALRVVATTGTARDPSMPLVPTMIEAGVANFTSSVWTGIAAPIRTPPAAVERLRAAFTGVMAAPEFRERLAQLGAVPAGGGPDALAAVIRDDLERWTRVARPLNIRLE